MRGHKNKHKVHHNLEHKQDKLLHGHTYLSIIIIIILCLAMIISCKTKHKSNQDNA